MKFADQDLPDLSLIVKKSTVEVMNIEFKVEKTFTPIDVTQKGRLIESYFLKTNFNSSLKIIQLLNPKHVFILNSVNDSPNEKLFKQYKLNFKN